MNRIKILHCGDLHFDTPFSELPFNIAEIRKEELKETFSNIIDLAKEQKVNCIFIAGDLFDNLRVEKTTLQFLVRKMEEAKPIRVFIAPGNHDPFNGTSFYKLISWPDNVYIFKEELEAIELPEFNSVVYGIGFGTSYIKNSLVEHLSTKGHKDKIKLMVLHGEIVKGEEGSDYNPISLKQIENSGLDYLALGHKHEFSGILKEGKTNYAYSGCPEGRGFDEIGEKGIIIGEVGVDYVDLKFKSICKRKYNVIDIDITGALSYEDIKEKVLGYIDLGKSKNDFYKLNFIGEISEEFALNKNVILEKLKNYFFYLKVQDSTKVLVDIEEVSKQFSIKGIFVKKLMERINQCQEEEEKAVLELALKVGIQSLSESEVKLGEN